MKWETYSLCMLILLSISLGLLSYTTQPRETTKLLLWASEWGGPPKNFTDISDLPWGKQIWAVANASMLTHCPIEITEDSVLREWAESMLKNDTRVELDVKVGEEYYGIGIGYFTYTTPLYPPALTTIIPLVILAAWITYLA
ncbi:MAG: hypothetical protein ACPL4I_12385, partial [Bacteroidota bacterium]